MSLAEEDIDDAHPGYGEEYLLFVADGVSEDQISDALKHVFKRVKGGFRTAQWTINFSNEEDKANGYPYTVGIDGWPGPVVGRKLLQEILGVQILNEDEIDEIPYQK